MLTKILLKTILLPLFHRETAKTLPGAGPQWDKSPELLLSNHWSQGRVRKGHMPIWFPGVSPYIARHAVRDPLIPHLPEA